MRKMEYTDKLSHMHQIRNPVRRAKILPRKFGPENHTQTYDISEKFRYDSGSKLKIVTPIQAEYFPQMRLLMIEDIHIKP